MAFSVLSGVFCHWDTRAWDKLEHCNEYTSQTWAELFYTNYGLFKTYFEINFLFLWKQQQKIILSCTEKSVKIWSCYVMVNLPFLAWIVANFDMYLTEYISIFEQDVSVQFVTPDPTSILHPSALNHQSHSDYCQSFQSNICQRHSYCPFPPMLERDETQLKISYEWMASHTNTRLHTHKHWQTKSLEPQAHVKRRTCLRKCKKTMAQIYTAL